MGNPAPPRTTSPRNPPPAGEPDGPGYEQLDEVLSPLPSRDFSTQAILCSQVEVQIVPNYLAAEGAEGSNGTEGVTPNMTRVASDLDEDEDELTRRSREASRGRDRRHTDSPPPPEVRSATTEP